MANGYSPTRDQMRVIAEAARDFHRVVQRWIVHAGLPGFPVESWNRMAIQALFELERALNPEQFPWGTRRRDHPQIRCWALEVEGGVVWLRNLLNRIMERNRLQALANRAGLIPCPDDADALPQVITVEGQELKALRAAIRMLPRLDTLPLRERLPEAQATIEPAPRAVENKTADSGISVILVSRTVMPIVLGKRKPILTQEQYNVVQAILDSRNQRLSKKEIEGISGDAIGVLKRLAKSDADWGAVIKLPGKAGNGYRIGPPDTPAEAGTRQTTTESTVEVLF